MHWESFHLGTFFLIFICVASLYQTWKILFPGTRPKTDLPRSSRYFALLVRLAGLVTGSCTLFLVYTKNPSFHGSDQFVAILAPLAGFLAIVPIRLARKVVAKPATRSRTAWKCFWVLVVVVWSVAVVFKHSFLPALVFNACEGITIAMNTPAEPSIASPSAISDFASAMSQYSWHELHSLIPSAMISMVMGSLLFCCLILKLSAGPSSPSKRSRDTFFKGLFALLLLSGTVIAWYQINTIWPRICPYISEIWNEGLYVDNTWIATVCGFLAGGLLVSWSCCYELVGEGEIDDSKTRGIAQPKFVLIIAGLTLATLFVPWIVFLIVELVSLIFPLDLYGAQPGQWPLVGWMWKSISISIEFLLLYLAIFLLIFVQVFTPGKDANPDCELAKPSLVRLISNWLLLSYCVPLFCVLTIGLPVLILMTR